MYKLDGLAEAAGVTPRTVRYYIQRGLLPPPQGQKRGCYYTEEHLDRLRLIIRLSSRGLPLIQIQNIFNQGKDPQVQEKSEEAVSSTSWERVAVIEGIELSFRKGMFNSMELAKLVTLIRDFSGKDKVDENKSSRRLCTTAK